MLDVLAYFFRGVSDGYHLVIGSPIHLLIASVCFLSVIMLISRRKYFAAHSVHEQRFRFLLASVLAAIEVIYYLWSILSGAFTVSNSLPLYTCNAVLLTAVIAFLFDNRFCRAITVYWGVYTLAAILIPLMEEYSFPHITNFLFFITHTLLLWAVCVIVVFEEYSFSSHDLRKVLAFTTVFLVIVYFIDQLLGANYAFFFNAPFTVSIVAALSPPIYSLLVIGGYDLLIVFIYMLGRVYRKHLQKFEQ